jgi:hypothetical protein
LTWWTTDEVSAFRGFLIRRLEVTPVGPVVLCDHLSVLHRSSLVQIEPPTGKPKAKTVLVGFFHRTNNRFIVNSASFPI